MSVVVLKVGGRVAADAARAAVDLHASGHEVVVVHGAGPQISQEMERRGIPIEFVAGRRVTTADGLAVVRGSLLEVNGAVCAAIGPLAIGLVGDEIGLLARQARGLGLVGDPIPCAPDAIAEALAAGRIPVVAPIGVGPLNVNADEAAAALAVGLGAERVQFVTDVPGVLVDDLVLASISADDADERIDAGEFEGGIVPKLLAAAVAARGGVRAEIGETLVVA